MLVAAFIVSIAAGIMIALSGGTPAKAAGHIDECTVAM